MDRKTSSMVIVIVGAVILGVGVFMPLVSVPRLGSVNLIGPGDYPRAAMFIPAVIALVLALLGYTRHAIWCGLVSLAAVGYGYYRVVAAIEQFEARFGDGLLGKVVDKATQLIQFQIGWAFLVLGGVLMVVGGVIAWRDAPKAGPAEAKPAQPLPTVMPTVFPTDAPPAAPPPEPTAEEIAAATELRPQTPATPKPSDPGREVAVGEPRE